MLAAGSRKQPSPAARHPDFHGEPAPKKEPPFGLILQGWVANTYLERDTQFTSGPLAMAKVSPFKFLQEVRAETQKVTWPSRRETMITTLMVGVMEILDINTYANRQYFHWKKYLSGFAKLI